MSCGPIGLGSILKIAIANIWTLWCHVEVIAHHHYRPRRNPIYDFYRLGIAGTRHMLLQDNTVDDKDNKSASEASVKDFEDRNDQTLQEKSNGSQTKKYSVNDIVKHVGNDRQSKLWCDGMDTAHIIV